MRAREIQQACLSEASPPCSSSIKPFPSEFRADICTPFDTKPTWPLEWPLHVSMRLTFAFAEPRLLSDPPYGHPKTIIRFIAKSIDGGNNAANLPMTLTGVQRLAS
ncbi:hypothetical protein TsFJ059_000400 [Trichoderma semiorbis]|uniref:Uncharacterized protein n=1 Tax=Trichoderma semiorbis TaxID=1491008 RepID=A0A9P8HUI8_9HYPO|nr:hypothetical protein TsFJ059_000400 [Trichoderma semiorbis]